MKILLTRPLEQAARTKERLEALGHIVDLAPMMKVRFLKIPDLPEKVGGLIFTSQNGIKAAEGLPLDSSLPAFCIGDSTSKAARAAGFSDVRTAGGNADALYHLISADYDPEKTSLLHLAGRHIAGNLVERLRADGYVAHRITAYEAKAVRSLSAHVVRRLAESSYGAILFYSPRTAKIFAELVRGGLEKTVAVCLSPAVAKAMPDLCWKRILLAKMPTERHLLGALAELQQGSGP